MRTKVKKIGGGLVIRIPNEIAEQLSISADTIVEISVVEKQLVISPVVKPMSTLDKFLAAITEENIHREIKTGPVVGNEYW